MVNNNRPTVLSIAGFDPSGGAGLLADIKAFEQLKCYGLGVSTALTVQNDVKFEKTKWIEWEFIKEQLQLLFERFPIAYVKIGIVENLMVLRQIINFILDQNKSAKIVLDPVLKSSTGFIFHKAPTDFQ
ncbi:MAG: bifunctional hydroxymethylpyrimidine kinase/phosphomethylpyrimidine kinase, partial [Bacteroidota bacterium]